MDAEALRLVHALKYEGAFALADPMGRALAPAARRLAGGAEAGSGAGTHRSPGPSRTGPALVPVPLSPARRRERGYNQAELLARGLAGATGWPVRPLLVRRPGGDRQARLGRRARRRNVETRFALRPGAVRRGWEARAGVLLVDDVLTTGATALACARALVSGGLRPLGVVSFARALQRLEGG